MGLKFVPPSDSPKHRDFDFDLNKFFRLNLSQLKFRKDWFETRKLKPEEMPSTTIIPRKVINRNLPLLSIVADRNDLYDKSLGIFANPFKKGRNWERLSYISFFNRGELQFATGAGLRVHGGKSRGHKVKNLRIHFRGIYGKDRFKNGVIFDKMSDPIKHIVVKKPIGDFFLTDSFGFDISKKIGCIVPKTELVVVYLNGKLHGDGFFHLYEHVGKQFLKSHYGHVNFIFLRTKKKRKNRIWPVEYKELRKWAGNRNIKMTMDEVRKHVKLDNLIFWWISQIFSANSDPYQGMAVLNMEEMNPKWFWINWDMDHSIINVYEKNIKIWEQKLNVVEFFENKTNEIKEDPRAVLLRRLLNEDDHFRKYFQKQIMIALNYKINRQYLHSRLQHYKKIAEQFGIKNKKYIEQTRLFIENRHAFVFKLFHDYFRFPEIFSFTVKGAKTFSFEINGYKFNSEYSGWYFKGTEVSVKFNDKNIQRIWQVNGKRIKAGDKFSILVNSNITISPDF